MCTKLRIYLSVLYIQNQRPIYIILLQTGVCIRHLSREAGIFEGELLSHNLTFHSQNSSSEAPWTFLLKTSSTRQVSHMERDPRLRDIMEINVP